jgi:hypothetical protein
MSSRPGSNGDGRNSCVQDALVLHDNHPAFDERHAVTKRFVEWVAGEGRKVTFLSLSKQSGVNEKVIRQIFAKAEKATDRPRAEMPESN